MPTMDSTSSTGTWSEEELIQSINLLDLRVIRLGLLAFRDLLVDQHALTHMNNMTAEVYINREGGDQIQATSSQSDTVPVGRDSCTVSQSCACERLHGHDGGLAKQKGIRSVRIRSLHHEVFQQIQERFSDVEMDLFAVEQNCQVQRFIVKAQSPQAIGWML